MRATLRRIPGWKRKGRKEKRLAHRAKVAAPRVNSRRRLGPEAPSRRARKLPPPLPVTAMGEIEAIVEALEQIAYSEDSSQSASPYLSYEIVIELGDADIVGEVTLE